MDEGKVRMVMINIFVIVLMQSLQMVHIMLVNIVKHPLINFVIIILVMMTTMTMERTCFVLMVENVILITSTYII